LRSERLRYRPSYPPGIDDPSGSVVAGERNPAVSVYVPRVMLELNRLIAPGIYAH
jgi:hypothetical protein